MDVFTLSIGVAFGILLAIIVPYLLLAVVRAVFFGILGVYDYFQPERTLVYEFNPADDSANAYLVEENPSVEVIHNE